MDVNDQGRRAAARIKAKLKVRFKSADSFINEYTSNISKGGLFIRTNTPCELRDRVAIVLVIPGTEMEVTALGEVIHVIGADQATAGMPAGMGIQLLELKKEDQERIEGYIKAELKLEADILGRRQHARVETRLRVRFESKEALVEEYIHNISHGGIFIQTKKPKQVGEHITLVLIHPETSQEIMLKGEVARVVTEENALKSNTHPGMGIKFKEMEPYVRKQIDEFIKAETARNAGKNLIVEES
jgi:type IV pilus assembly protein PilZ